MNNKTLIGLVLVLSFVGGLVGAKLFAPNLGGDFAGGIQPSNLWTGNATTNSVTPNLSNVLIPGTVSIGGTGTSNQVTVAYTAVGFYPTAAQNLLGPIGSGTSTTSTALSFTASGFSVGDSCALVNFNGNTSTIPLDLSAAVSELSAKVRT